MNSSVNNASTDQLLSRNIQIIDESHLALSLIVILGLQFVFFLLTGFCGLQKISNATGGFSFVIVALMTFFLAQTFQIRQIIVTSFVCIWAGRLSTYLLWRSSYAITNANNESSSQLTDETHKWPRLIIFWSFQAVWIFTVSLPVILINAQKYIPIRNESQWHLTDIDTFGIVMWTTGFLCEFFADIQKFRFRQKLSNENKFCTDGLWTWSRHPNYFGEIVLWWGVFCIYTQIVCNEWMWVGILSPLFVTSILLFLSGVWPLEQSADQRYGHNPKYQEYKYSTSPLIPMPPELYVKFPRWIQMACLADFPIYDNIPQSAKPREKTEKTAPVTTRRLEMPY